MKKQSMKDKQEKESEVSEAEIDKNAEDSFPASDPPSWSLGVEPKDEHDER